MKRLLLVFVVLVLLMPIAVNGETKWVKPADIIVEFPRGIGIYIGSVHYLIYYQTLVYYSDYVEDYVGSKAILEKEVKASVTFGSYSIKNIPTRSSSIDLKFHPGSIVITGDTVNNLRIGIKILQTADNGEMKIRVEEMR